MKKGKHSTFNIQHSMLKDSEAVIWEFNEGAAESENLILKTGCWNLRRQSLTCRKCFQIPGRAITSPDKFCVPALRHIPTMAKLKLRNLATISLTNSKFASKNCGRRAAGQDSSNGKRGSKMKPSCCLCWVESEELIRIFHSSIQTAKRNSQTESRQSSNPGSYTSVRSWLILRCWALMLNVECFP